MSRQKWEHKILYRAHWDARDLLDKYGTEGWELVSVVFIPRGSVFLHYFKRPVPDVGSHVAYLTPDGEVIP